MVSIVIPVYNVEKYLRQCLKSVLAQTFFDWEAIVVDDGSTDASGRIADEFAAADARIKVVHQANGGLSVARNTGIGHASGDWIYFLDSDDAISARAVEECVAVAEREHCDVVVAMATHGEDGLDRGTGKTTALTPEEAIAITLHQRRGMLNSAWGKLFRARLLDAERFTPGIWYEDLDFFYRVYEKAGRIARLDRAHYFYRQHSGSFLGTWKEGRLDVLDVTERIEQWAARRDGALIAAARDRCFSAACNMFLLTARLCPEHPRRDAMWQLIKERRREVAFGSGVRLKNRIGAIVSYLGPRVFGRLG